ncbi:top2, partial [Symbiodinium sp. KB8]
MSKTVVTSEDSTRATSFSCASWIRARVSPSSAGAADGFARSPSGALSNASSGRFVRSLSPVRVSQITTGSLTTGKDVSEREEDSDVEEQDLMDHTGSMFVMKESNKFRK